MTLQAAKAPNDPRALRSTLAQTSSNDAYASLPPARQPATGFGTRRTSNSQQDLIPGTPLKKKPRHIAGACVSKGPLPRSGCLASPGKAQGPLRPDQQNGTRRQRHGRQCGVEDCQRRGVRSIRKRRTLLELDDKVGAPRTASLPPVVAYRASADPEATSTVLSRRPLSKRKRAPNFPKTSSSNPGSPPVVMKPETSVSTPREKGSLNSENPLSVPALPDTLTSTFTDAALPVAVGAISTSPNVTEHTCAASVSKPKASISPAPYLKRIAKSLSF